VGIVIIIILVVAGLFGLTSGEEAISEPVMVSCVSTDGSTKDCDEIWQPVDANGVAGVIVGVDDGNAFTSAEEYWYPGDEDVAAAEQAIAARQGPLEHMRQYVGYIEDGDRKILVNGFCDAFDSDWLHEPVLVLDGGECFFTAVYNVTTGELESFSFNGEA